MGALDRDSLWRQLVPHEWGDRISLTAFAIVLIPLVLVFEVFIVLPELYPDWCLTYWIHLAMAAWFTINIYGNLLLFITTNTSIAGRMFPHVLREGWGYCSACESNAPPRSHHCPFCRICILRRDHHCSFVGKCVGLFNARYFLMMSAHLAVSLLYANALNIDLILGHFSGLSFTSVITAFLPVVAWLFGLAGNYLSFIRSCALGFIIVAFFFTAMLTFYHGRLFARGQTAYEQTRGCWRYDCGWRTNVESLLGSRWQLVWVLPWLSSPLDGDGITYKERSMVSTNTKYL